MKTKWQLIWTESALNKLKKIDKHIAKVILVKTTSAIEQADDIKLVLKPLKYAKKGQYRFRVGNYRVICRIIENQCVVEAITIGHRKNIYK